VALVGASTVLAASPAYADDPVVYFSNTYHSWTGYISYDYALKTISVNMINGYSTSQTEALWISIGGDKIETQGYVIPAGSGAGFDIGAPIVFAQVCGGIDTVTIVCGTFPTSP
jgi:hypothetical protein